MSQKLDQQASDWIGEQSLWLHLYVKDNSGARQVISEAVQACYQFCSEYECLKGQAILSAVRPD